MNNEHNFCEFVDLGGGDFYCSICGRTVYSHDGEPPLMPCSKNMNQDPNCCSQQQILYRYEICQHCEKFDDNICLECGCSISSATHFTNKLFWKNNSCPLNKWNKLN
jgi:hypothetical protein